MNYNPANWYWVVGGDETRAYSSASAAYVPASDATFMAWLADENIPTAIDTEAALNDVLLAQYPAGALHPSPQLSPLVFIGRFTPAEQSAIVTAAQSNAAMLLWLVQAAGAQYIDLTDQRTKAGLDALVTAGFLTAERETAILTP